MTDRDRRQLRGPVQTMRTETSEWDAAAESWKASRSVDLITFHSDGNVASVESRVEKHTSNTAYQYDASGKLTAIESWGDAGPKTGMEFTYDASGRPAASFVVDAGGTRRQTETFAYDSDGRKTRVQMQAFAGLPDDGEVHESQSWQNFLPGASSPDTILAVITVIYDADHRPIEVLAHSPRHQLQYRVTFTRDGQGRLLTGETIFNGLSALGPEMEQKLEELPADERATTEAALEIVFERETFLSATYSYDGNGRLLESIRRVGTIMEDVATFRYDERGTLVEQTSVDRSHGLDGDGRPTPEFKRELQTRYDHQFDSHGNWTERVVWTRNGDGADFQRAGLDRRAFTYYAS